MECKPQFRRAYRFLISTGEDFHYKNSAWPGGRNDNCVYYNALIYSVLQIYRDKAESPYYRLYDILLLKNVIFSQ